MFLKTPHGWGCGVIEGGTFEEFNDFINSMQDLCIFVENLSKLFVDENSTKSQNVPPKNDQFVTKIYNLPCKL